MLSYCIISAFVCWCSCNQSESSCRDRCPTVSHCSCARGCGLSPPRRCSQRPSRLEVRQRLARLCGQRPARLCGLQTAQPACHRLGTTPTPAASPLPPPPEGGWVAGAALANGIKGVARLYDGRLAGPMAGPMPKAGPAVSAF